MASNRVIFNAEQLLIAPGLNFTAFASGHVVHGAQSVGMNGNVPITSIYELGQATPYEQMEEISDFTVSVDKVLDGYPLAWHLATKDASTPDLLGRSTARCHLGMSIYPETQAYASGTADFACLMSGFYPTNLSYQINTQGPSRESLSFVGNTRKWYSSAYRASEASAFNMLTGFFTGTNFTTPDAPSAASGINRREDVLFDYVTASIGNDANGLPVYPSGSTFPRNIPGIDSNGKNVSTAGVSGCDYTVKMQSIKFTAGITRQDIFELGCKFPYVKSVNPTIDCNTEIEIIAISGDFIEALEGGLYSTGENTRNESIRVALRDGTRISTGTKNRLTSFSVGGGGTDGSNMTVTYTYTNKNNFSVLHPADPRFGAGQNGYTITSGIGSGSYYN